MILGLLVGGGTLSVSTLADMTGQLHVAMLAKMAW